uniref:Uncharacterized protein n=1 Tax=Pipistrellus kuhlii TaxID=59472 RepID=A0A7J7YX92_PIPKU|nr:hypothetical protein mPipKuh1_009858 [Pipistrellus kuhlii]
MARGSRERDSKCHPRLSLRLTLPPGHCVNCRLPLTFLSLCSEERLRAQAASLPQVAPASFLSPSHLLVLFYFLQALLPGSLISLHLSEPAPMIAVTGGDIFRWRQSCPPPPLLGRPSDPSGLTAWLSGPAGTSLTASLFYFSLFHFWLPGFLFLITCGIAFHTKANPVFRWLGILQGNLIIFSPPSKGS